MQTKDSKSPVNVRNFWVTLDIDGAAERIKGGSRGKEGGFQISINTREKGEISSHLVELIGSSKDGINTLSFYSGHILRYQLDIIR